MNIFVFIFSLIICLMPHSSFSQTRNQTQNPHPATKESKYTQQDLISEFHKLQRDLEKAKQQMQQYEKLMKELNRPAIKKTMVVMSDPVVIDSFSAVMKRTNWKKLMIAQLITLLTIMLIKSWRMAKTRKWSERLSISLVSFILTILITGFVVPRILIGKSYSQLFTNIYHTYKKA